MKNIGTLICKETALLLRGKGRVGKIQVLIKTEQLVHFLEQWALVFIVGKIVFAPSHAQWTKMISVKQTGREINYASSLFLL